MPTPPEGLPAIRNDSAWLMVLQLCGDAADHKNRALDFRLRRPHVVTLRIWPRVTTTQELALCKTSRTIRFQERRQ